MNQKEEMFRKGLAEIRKKAAGNFNHITVEEIVKSFPGMELTKKQIDITRMIRAQLLWAAARRS